MTMTKEWNEAFEAFRLLKTGADSLRKEERRRLLRIIWKDPDISFRLLVATDEDGVQDDKWVNPYVLLDRHEIAETLRAVLNCEDEDTWAYQKRTTAIVSATKRLLDLHEAIPPPWTYDTD